MSLDFPSIVIWGYFSKTLHTLQSLLSLSFIKVRFGKCYRDHFAQIVVLDVNLGFFIVPLTRQYYAMEYAGRLSMPRSSVSSLSSTRIEAHRIPRTAPRSAWKHRLQRQRAAPRVPARASAASFFYSDDCFHEALAPTSSFFLIFGGSPSSNPPSPPSPC